MPAGAGARPGRAARPRGPRAGGRTACRRCGAAAEWHPTLRGRWLLLEPGERPVSAVPPGRRWRIAGDGTAVGLGRAFPSGTCRVSHVDGCDAPPVSLPGAVAG
ncbi:DUF6083 domain-containing protein [Streptacidiphilus sp. ASG 303]|uniref:DUF6083 domain-containing protein n=1 Tax=Streptacidiphilus sp. ASG 303 TaxID=2896847 RepID=UPI001E4D996E|nr:DUF6083 domain-containing protein [Streptacidiphilus sp. ASG 303]MCD0482308.1 DUF6083 domain-containing protein [Streptacidiphilus sp. ASG 303]